MRKYVDIPNKEEIELGVSIEVYGNALQTIADILRAKGVEEVSVLDAIAMGLLDLVKQ
ncbi:hypothetical protein [Vibrio rumoiensis]|uniref:hypothetical protein n=1 Tax=Vibrio rumoiensis TaxID=76258 RepID=UPI003AA92CA1